MLQDLCPRCGAELHPSARRCPECGLGGAGRSVRTGSDLVRPLELIVAVSAILGLLTVPFGAEPSGAPVDTAVMPVASAGSSAAAIPTIRPIGVVRFVEQLRERPGVETYRTTFAREETIAWRAELPEPPGTNELTLVIAWQSVREVMVLSTTSVRLRDDRQTSIASDEVPITDLVPTTGVYAVTYYDGETKLAAGVFELLPRKR